jgi:hypothetical protein
MEELTLKCRSSTQLHVLFGETWLVQTSHVRLKGVVPYDRCAFVSGQGGCWVFLLLSLPPNEGHRHSGLTVASIMPMTMSRRAACCCAESCSCCCCCCWRWVFVAVGRAVAAAACPAAAEALRQFHYLATPILDWS